MRQFFLNTLVLMLLSLPFAQAQVQNISLTVNGDEVKNNDVYNFYPTYLELTITKGDRSYKLNKGKITLARGKNIIQTVNIDTNYIAHEYAAVSSKIKGGDKVIIDIYEIEENPIYRTFQDSVQVDDTTWVLKDTVKMINSPIVPVKFSNRFLMFTLAGTPKIKTDPNCAILINKTNNYVRQGLGRDTIKTIEFLLAPSLKAQPVALTILRPDRDTKPVTFKSTSDFINKSKDIFKFTLPGDVMVFEIKKTGEKTCHVSIPIY